MSGSSERKVNETVKNLNQKASNHNKSNYNKSRDTIQSEQKKQEVLVGDLSTKFRLHQQCHHLQKLLTVERLLPAPLAEYSSFPLREALRLFGSVVTWIPLVHIRSLPYWIKDWQNLLRIYPEKNCILQIHGRAEDFREFHKHLSYIEDLVKSFPNTVIALDINAGCPMPKIAGKGSGAGLLRNLNELEEVVKIVMDNTSLPVTVKCRIGFENWQFDKIAEILIKTRPAMVCVHTRLAVEKYSGSASRRWHLVKTYFKAMKKEGIVTCINGDITDTATFLRALAEAGSDLAAVGRAQISTPAAIAQISGRLPNKLPIWFEAASLVLFLILTVNYFVRTESSRNEKVTNTQRALSFFKRFVWSAFKGARGVKGFRRELAKLDWSKISYLIELIFSFVKTNYGQEEYNRMIEYLSKVTREFT